MRFENKQVLITGGSTGMGFATAKAFIHEGAGVIITGKNPDNLRKATEEINSPKLKAVVSDIADLSDIANLEKVVVQSGRKLDVVFLNAGISIFTPIAATTVEDFDAMFNVNVRGLFFTLQKLIPHLAENASILVTSSGSATTSRAGTSVYSATKAAVNVIARIAANELSDKKIRVNIISPGLIDTPILAKSMPVEAVQALKANISTQNAVKRIGKPEDIANTALFLASDEASFISGVELLIDGGFRILK
ncbi:SDR family oxidoreductase [Parafilimonas sp.]|uniref:SDR family oxidoreductase n=1 Tax=Parafilimonas sp. TaxID=1969739 RepID=UPI0039E46111